MASAAVVSAIEGAIGTIVNGTRQWTSGVTGDVLPVLNLNDSADKRPTNGAPFIVLEYPVSNEQWLTVGAPGANIFKEIGGFRIILSEKRTVGMARAYGWIDELRTLFRGITFLSGALQCFESPPSVINNDSDLGNYFEFSFVVPYRYYIQG